jgi:hypothetical protein
LFRSMLYHNFLICWSMILLGQLLGNETYRKIIIASRTRQCIVARTAAVCVLTDFAAS